MEGKDLNVITTGRQCHICIRPVRAIIKRYFIANTTGFSTMWCLKVYSESFLVIVKHPAHLFYVCPPFSPIDISIVNIACNICGSSIEHSNVFTLFPVYGNFCSAQYSGESR